MEGQGLWEATADPAPLRAALPGDTTADVVIVGAGYTGLWTAYALRDADPGLRVVVLERDRVGAGASGRNGGWCSALFAGRRERIAARHGRDAVRRLQREMFATVDEVGRVAAAEGIDCDFAKGGTLEVARTAFEAERLRAAVEEQYRWGFGAEDYSWLPPGEAADRIGATPNLGAAFTPHCAALHPARLVRGLAAAVERRGAVIHEGTEVTAIAPGRVDTAHGVVRAEVVVRATEAFTPQLPGLRRELAPVYSLMIATEPLSPAFWAEAGLARRETFADGRRLIIYGQRTADGRLAFGGRGAPYHFGSRLAPRFERDAGVFARLEATLRGFLPGLGSAAITHRWGGAVGVPRDWHSGVGFDRDRGLAWAGGYVGDGVATSNLAGRTLADLVLGRAGGLVDLPWVGHRSPRWEPEPLRWAAINGARALTASIDRAEGRGRRARRRSRLLDRFVG